jgi:hypothetical protein
MSALRPELRSGRVLRLARRSPDDLYIEDRLSPQMEDFRLASNELKEAAAIKCGQLSVYDRQITTAEQARALMSKPSKYPWGFHLSVEAILNDVGFDLHVFRDPNPNGDMREGAQGHCVIENVWSEDEDRMQDIRAELMRIAQPVEEAITD